MKTTKTGTASGCLVWILAFGILNVCFLPVAMMIGGFSSVSNFAMQTVERFYVRKGLWERLIPMRQPPPMNTAIHNRARPM